MIVHSNVKDGRIVFHKLPVNEERQKAWIHAVSKGRKDFGKPKHFKVYSYPFLEGKPAKCNPDPTLFLKISTNTLPTPTKRRPSPKKRCVSSSLANNIEIPLQFRDSTPIIPSNLFRTFVADDPKQALSSRKSIEMGELLREGNKTNQNLYDDNIIIPLRFNQIVLDGNVPFFTGLDGPAVFEALFDYVFTMYLQFINFYSTVWI